MSPEMAAGRDSNSPTDSPEQGQEICHGLPSGDQPAKGEASENHLHPPAEVNHHTPDSQPTAEQPVWHGHGDTAPSQPAGG